MKGLQQTIRFWGYSKDLISIVCDLMQTNQFFRGAELVMHDSNKDDTYNNCVVL